jgi:hypothetical protein
MNMLEWSIVEIMVDVAGEDEVDAVVADRINKFFSSHFYSLHV